MNFIATTIPGLLRIIPDVYEDNRGRFHRTFCGNELVEAGTQFTVRQGNLSDNLAKLTLRGFHYQKFPTLEAKVITCVTGAIYNVVIDLRPDSPTLYQWESLEVSAAERHSIHVPAGCANAFLTLDNNTSVHYYMSEYFVPDTYRGIRYNDPFFNVSWPYLPEIISPRDAAFPDFLPS